MGCGSAGMGMWVSRAGGDEVQTARACLRRSPARNDGCVGCWLGRLWGEFWKAIALTRLGLGLARILAPGRLSCERGRGHARGGLV